ncbi:MAG: hypothetical protein JSS38_18400 [Nitrospira sp.]|nr:hypothetical protein [Nitrospira sp.]
MPSKSTSEVDLEKITLLSLLQSVKKLTIASVMLIISIEGIIAGSAFTIGKYYDQFWNHVSTDTTYSVPLEAIFGRSHTGEPSARLIPPNEKEVFLNKQLNNAQRKIKIVTLRGEWLLGEQRTFFLKALRNVSVELFMPDFKDDRLYNIVQDAIGRDDHGTLPQSTYAQTLLVFGDQIKDSKDFKIGVTGTFPWTRFTIFDDKAVSFVLTPGISGGPSIPSFFTEDPSLVKVFIDLYDKIKTDSKPFFTSLSETQDYVQ